MDISKKTIDREIEKVLTGKPKKLYDAANHISSAGGKRLRPILCLLACESLNGKTNNALKSAISLELMHTFSLIHDDIMDHDELRRNVKTVHVLYGEPTAILAGDLLFSKAFELCDPKATKILAHASVDLCEGQELDMEFEERTFVSEREYVEMIKKKTASLFEASTAMGAVLAGGSEKQVRAFSEYGQNLGMAFQIYDDLLDLLADEKKLGKPVFSDIAEGKKTLIVVRAMESLRGMERDRLAKLLHKTKKSKKETDEIFKLLKESGAIEYAKQKSRGYINNAKKSLEKIPDSKAKDELLRIADFVVEREF